MVRKMIVAISLVIIVSLSAFAAYYFSYYSYTHPSTVTPISSGDNAQVSEAAPTELTTAFDPTTNVSIFKYLTFDNGLSNPTLERVWPNRVEGQSYTPQLACAKLDTKVFYPEQTLPTYVESTEIWGIMKQYDSSQVLFSGLCRDPDCTIIDKKCELHITADIEK